jgi:hypothetical protein
VIRSHYDGSASHDFDIQAWNFTASAWVDIGHIPDQTAQAWVNSTHYDMRIPADYINGGEARIRLYHTSAGNINHNLFLDFINLYAELPTDAVATTTEGVDWLAIALILSLSMVFLISKVKR